MSKLDIKKIVILKQGISFFILEANVKGHSELELEFKTEQMNDVLKSLTALDDSEKGYISSISYDAAIETSKLLESVMLDIPDTDSFSSLVRQIKGAPVKVKTSEIFSGIIMGIEFIEKTSNQNKITEKQLALLKDDGAITKIPFSEITSLDIVNESIKKDLKFFLETVIAGKKKDVKNIKINCESGGNDEVERKIIVSYLHESPVWKISYRIIMSKKQEKEQKCLIAGFSLIENVTNKDWENVYISLVAGMTVSFIYNAYPAIYITRPRIEPPRIATARPTEIEDGITTEEFKAYDRRSGMGAGPSMPMAAAKVAMQPMAPPPAPGGAARGFFAADMDDETVMNKMTEQTKTQTKDLGELFEYSISNPVSIKRKHSALVPILTEEIKARKILLYNKNQHDKNPDACLEITNTSGLMLERGPVTIIYDDNLAGEAIIPFLNKDDTRLLNYAVEQAVIITYEEKSESRNIHRIQISSAYSYEYYYTDLFTIYKIKNNTDDEKDLYLDHPKKSGYKVEESPIDPEETPNYWRFKLKIKPKEAISFKIRERIENYSSYYIYNYSKDDLLKRVGFYVRQKFINPDLEKKLNEIGELIGKKRDIEEQKSKLESERYEMTEAQTRIRNNISVLGDTQQEKQLREKYVKKLTIQEERYEKISADIDNLEKQLKVLNKEIDEKIQILRLN